MVVYLDYNATTPCAPEVKEALVSAMDTAWGNPSSSHALGREAKLLVEESRKQVAAMINTDASNIIFTSGGTEANYMAIESAIFCYKNKLLGGKLRSNNKPHIITTNIEHDSISLHLKSLEMQGVIDATFLPVSKMTGQLEAMDVCNAVRIETCLVSVILANNETGIIQPISEIASVLATLHEYTLRSKILFHTDAAQAIGKMEVSVSDLKVDFMTIAGHKFYGPRIGAIYVKDFNKRPEVLQPVFYGGGQERGYRPGTENTAMIVGLGKAAELVNKNIDLYVCSMIKTRDYLEKKLRETFGQEVSLNNLRPISSEADGMFVPRLPNTVSVSFHNNSTGKEILNEAPELCASTGAACHSNSDVESNVLVNSGVPVDLAKSTLRLSVGRETTENEINEAVDCLQRVLKK